MNQKKDRKEVERKWKGTSRREREGVEGERW